MAEFRPIPQYAMPFLGDEEVLVKLGLKFNPQWLKWFIDMLDDITGSIINHNDLSSIQGGNATQRYHLFSPGGAGTFARSDGTDWQNSTLTLANTMAAGSIPHAATANNLTALAIGASAGQMLRSTGTLPAWSTTIWPNTAISGGVLYALAANTWATSVALGLTQVVLGGGAGGAPNTSANLDFDGTNLRVASIIGGTAANNDITIQGTSHATRATSYVLLQPTAGFVGVGTLAPVSNLHVASASTTTFASFTATDSTGTHGVSFFGGFSGGAGLQPAIDWSAGEDLRFGGGVTDFGTGAGFAQYMVIKNGGNVGIGVAGPSAVLHLKAGTTAASTGQLKLDASTLLTAPEAGVIERVTDDLHFTIGTGTARKKIVLDDGTALSSGRVPVATTNGRLTDDADLTFATDTLTCTKYKTPTPVQLITSGTAAVAGNATLAAGTITVNTTAVTANSVILLTRKTSGGTIGTAITYTINAGTSFTITSDSVLDTSTFSWVIVEGY